MKQTTIVGLCLATGASTTAAFGSTTFDTMVVTGHRTSTTVQRQSRVVTVIEREQIERSQATSLAELLASRGGVEVLDFFGDGSRASFGLQGFGENAGSNTLILIDGVPLNNPDIANPDLGRIRLDNIERVEILAGGSALWGHQAVGGVINIVTRDSPGSGLAFRRGSFEGIDLHARTAGQFDNWHLSLGIGERRSDNFRDNNALQRSTARLSARYAGKWIETWLQLDYSDEFLQVPGGLFADEIAEDRHLSAPDFAGDFSAVITRQLTAGLDADLGQGWRFSGRAARYDTEGDFKLSFRGFAADPALQDRQVDSLNPQWTWQFRHRKRSGHIALGADIQRADYLLQSQFGQQRNAQSIDDFYLSTLVPVLRRLDLSLSLRQSQIEDDIADPGPFAVLPQGQRFRHEETLASVGLSLAVRSDWRVFGGWDQVLRYPKVDEYFGSGFTPDSIGLRPQTGDKLELGLRHDSESSRTTLSVYRLELDDEIVFDPTQFANTNLDRTRRNGMSLQSRWLPLSWLTAELSYQRIDAKIAGAQRIPLVAEQHGQLSVHLDAGHGWSLQTQLQAASSRLAGGDIDSSAARLPGYGIVNLAARWQHPQGVRLGLKLLNALDREYATVGFEDASTGQLTRFPLPGAHWRFELSYRL